MLRVGRDEEEGDKLSFPNLWDTNEEERTWSLSSLHKSYEYIEIM